MSILIIFFTFVSVITVMILLGIVVLTIGKFLGPHK